MNLGLTCQGPFSQSDHLVLEQCPGEVTIDLDTARLRPKRSNLILDSRCVACSFYKQLDYFLTKYYIELQDKNTMCIFHGCALFIDQEDAFSILTLSFKFLGERELLLIFDLSKGCLIMRLAKGRHFRLNTTFFAAG